MDSGDIHLTGNMAEEQRGKYINVSHCTVIAFTLVISYKTRVLRSCNAHSILIQHFQIQFDLECKYSIKEFLRTLRFYEGINISNCKAIGFTLVISTLR